MYIAVDIGGTKTLLAKYESDGQLLDCLKFKTNTDYAAFVADLIQKISDYNQGGQAKAVAIAVPGHVNEQGVIEGFGNLDWTDKDLVGDLSPVNLPIILDNDANFGALGEANMGAGAGKRKVLYVTVSTGIGTGVVIDGKIDPVMQESEGGQILLNHDGKVMAWEKFASGKAFYEHYGLEGKDVDNPAIWQDFAEDIAQGMWNLIALVQPDIVVVGGSMGVHFAKYGKFLSDKLAQFESPVIDHPPIVQAKDPDNAVINGCYQAAKQYVDAS
jgi:predicted NBD/HSP70 family sugar kinase